MAYDLLLRGGTVIDPSQGLHAPQDVAITGGAVAAVAEQIPANQATRVVDVSGKLVTPGLVDMHCHVFWGVGIGVDADAGCLPRGTTTVVEGGAPGAGSFKGFRKYVAERNLTRTYATLNLSTIGMVDLRWSEFTSFINVDVPAAIRTIEANRDILIGVKLRVSNYVVGSDPVPYLRLAREVADATKTNLFVHIGDCNQPLSAVLEYLKAGDMIVHCFTARRNGILDVKGKLLPAVMDARKRGVMFDASSGGNHFGFDVARKAIDQGFPPDILSTDITEGTAADPHFHMPLMMTRHLAVGMSMDDVVRASTVVPGTAINRVPKLGTLQVSTPADVAVLNLEEGEFVLQDTAGGEMKVNRRFEPFLTVIRGKVVGE